MRIPDGLRAASLLANINRNLDRVSLWENMISSGKQVTRASEDPGRFSSALSLSHAISLQRQCQENVADGLLWLSTSEAAAEEIQDVVGDAQTLVLEAASSASSAGSRAALADELNQSIESLLVSANSRLGELYVLGGTEVSRPAFAGIRDAQGKLTQVVFQGNSDAIARLLDPATGALRVNLDGRQLCLAQTCSLTGTTSVSDPTQPLAAEVPALTAGTFSVNGVSITVDPATDSLQALADRISSAVGDATASVVDGALRVTSLTASEGVSLATGTSSALIELGLLDASGSLTADQTAPRNLFASLIEARDLLLGWDGTGKLPMSLPLARLGTGTSGFVTAASGQADQAYSGEHRLRVKGVTLGAATVTSTSPLVTGATNLSLQSAGELRFSVDASGALVAGSISFEPAVLGGRELSATEQAALATLNAGGAVLTANTFAALGLELQLVGPPGAGDVTVSVAPTQATVEDVVVDSSGKQYPPASFALTANETQAIEGSPLVGTTLTLGEVGLGQTAVVVTESLASQLGGHMDVLNSQLAATGGAQAMFSSRARFLESGLVNLEAALSEAEDIDVIEATVQLKLAQNAYEAALAAASRAFSTSLLDYL